MNKCLISKSVTMKNNVELMLIKLITNIQNGQYTKRNLNSLCDTLRNWWTKNYLEKFPSECSAKITSSAEAEDITDFTLKQVYSVLSNIETAISSHAPGIEEIYKDSALVSNSYCLERNKWTTDVDADSINCISVSESDVNEARKCFSNCDHSVTSALNNNITHSSCRNRSKSNQTLSEGFNKECGIANNENDIESNKIRSSHENLCLKLKNSNSFSAGGKLIKNLQSFDINKETEISQLRKSCELITTNHPNNETEQFACLQTDSAIAELYNDFSEASIYTQITFPTTIRESPDMITDVTYEGHDSSLVNYDMSENITDLGVQLRKNKSLRLNARHLSEPSLNVLPRTSIYHGITTRSVTRIWTNGDLQPMHEIKEVPHQDPSLLIAEILLKYVGDEVVLGKAKSDYINSMTVLAIDATINKILRTVPMCSLDQRIYNSIVEIIATVFIRIIIDSFPEWRIDVVNEMGKEAAEEATSVLQEILY